jgi:hypothetical protein
MITNFPQFHTIILLLLSFSILSSSAKVYAKQIDTLDLLLTKVYLMSLGYYKGNISLSIVDSQLIDAVKTYEKKNGFLVTGNYQTGRTSKKLSEDIQTLDYLPVSLPNKSIVFNMWDQGYIKAEGTWRFKYNDISSPERTSCIECYKKKGICIDAQAHIQRLMGAMLFSNVDLYEIERWDETEIVTKPLDFSCQRYIIRFNRTSNTVSAIRSPISNNPECKGSSKTEMHMVLSDGFNVYWGLHKDRTTKWLKAMNIDTALIHVLNPKKYNENEDRAHEK